MLHIKYKVKIFSWVFYEAYVTFMQTTGISQVVSKPRPPQVFCFSLYGMDPSSVISSQSVEPNRMHPMTVSKFVSVVFYCTFLTAWNIMLHIKDKVYIFRQAFYEAHVSRQIQITSTPYKSPSKKANHGYFS